MAGRSRCVTDGYVKARRGWAVTERYAKLRLGGVRRGVAV